MITIKQPYIKHLEKTDRVISNIVVDDKDVPVWFEVPSAYGKYLTYERSDGFLIGMLSVAIRKHHDIICEAPVTEELLYQIRDLLLPSLVKYGDGMYLSKIHADIAPALDNDGAVGSGLSCGVDSMHVVSKFVNSEYKNMNVTHFTFYNVGAFNAIYNEAGIDKVRDECKLRAEQCAKELNIPLIITDSNFQEAFLQNHLFTHTFSSTFAIHMLQKLWKTYYYGSSGYDFSEFTLKHNDSIDAAYYELLSLGCFSTKKMTIYSEGGAQTRLEKQRDIAENSIAQKYLHVCTKSFINCNVCNKCKRTLLLFDAMGKLDEFSRVFDIDYYRLHRKEYLEYLYKAHIGEIHDPMLEPAYQILKNDHEMITLMQEKGYEDFHCVSDYKRAYEELSSEYESLIKEYYCCQQKCDSILQSYNYKTGEAILRIPKIIYKAVKKVI